MIAGMTYYQIFWYFMIYSFAGWCIEVIFHVFSVGKIINRGFLCGPVCPVYGFGVLSVFTVVYSVLPDIFHYPVEKLIGGEIEHLNNGKTAAGGRCFAMQWVSMCR